MCVYKLTCLLMNCQEFFNLLMDVCSMADISCIKEEKLPNNTQCCAISIRYSSPLALSSGWVRFRMNQQKL